MKFKMKIYYNNRIHDLDTGLEGNISINARFTISHLHDIKWYIFININITTLENYVYI